MSGTIERAFELASDGSCQSVDDIRRQLTREKHWNVDAHLSGTAIRRQLKARIAGMRAVANDSQQEPRAE